MHHVARPVSVFLLASLSLTALATDKVAGDRYTFASPNGVTETCVALAKMPTGV